MKAKRNIWLGNRPPRPRAQINLFCLPYAGGAASLFLP
jgi:hypothetical protein